MKAITQIRIQECNFHPTHIEIHAGSEIEIRIMPHRPTSTYDNNSRSFILSCSEFETQKLYPGDIYTWKFKHSGEFILTCPLYAWMKASIKVKPLKGISNYNPQDPDLLPVKPIEEAKHIPKVSITPYKKMYSGKEFLKYMSIPSSVTSEPDEEAKEECEPEEDELEKHIERLFLSVKDECERERIQTGAVEELIPEPRSEPIPKQLKEKFTEAVEAKIINVEKKEIKQGVIFTTRAMGPSKYFKKEDPNQKAKIKRLMKRKARQLKMKLKNNPKIVNEMIEVIISIKLNADELATWSDNIPKSAKGESLAEKRKLQLQQVIFNKKHKELQERFSALTPNFTNSMMEKVKIFLESDNDANLQEIISQDWAKRNLSIKLFGFNKFWWMDKLVPASSGETSELQLCPNFDYKYLCKVLKESKTYLGWNSQVTIN